MADISRFIFDEPVTFTDDDALVEEFEMDTQGNVMSLGVFVRRTDGTMQPIAGHIAEEMNDGG